MKYRKAGMGGTFDHFHVGHQSFITFASQAADHLIIGITENNLHVHKKYRETIESFEDRKRSVQIFCEKNTISYEIVILADPFGPTLSDPEIDVVVATEASITGAYLINSEREKLNLQPLSIEKASLLYDKESAVISSEMIRSGNINRNGENYSNVFKRDLLLSLAQRKFFSNPQGNIVTFPNKSAITWVVGDTTLENFIRNKWQYDVGCFDFLKRRSEYTPKVLSEKEIDLCTWNTAGVITQELVQTLQIARRDQVRHIFVQGEEDLAAVVAVLILPLGSHIYYGQPNVGMVELVVTEDKKQEIFQLLSSSSQLQ